MRMNSLKSLVRKIFKMSAVTVGIYNFACKAYSHEILEMSAEKIQLLGSF